jgi:hypothetical protein
LRRKLGPLLLGQGRKPADIGEQYGHIGEVTRLSMDVSNIADVGVLLAPTDPKQTPDATADPREVHLPVNKHKWKPQREPWRQMRPWRTWSVLYRMVNQAVIRQPLFMCVRAHQFPKPCFLVIPYQHR